MLRSPGRCWLFVVVAVIGALWTHCVAWADDAPTEQETSQPQATTDEAPAAPPANPYVVPDGSVEQILAFVNRLMIDRWPSDEDRIRDAKRAVSDAASKILMADPTDSQARIAVKVKLFSLQTHAECIAFVEELKTMGRDELAKQAADRVAEMGQKLRREAIEAEIQSLAKSGAEDVTTRLEKLIDDLTEMLGEENPTGEDVRLAAQSAQLADRLGRTDCALGAYRAYINILSEHGDGFEDEIAAMQVLVRWLDLPGNELQLEGTLLDGTPLDWSKYRGKVVLVDFWATWCGPCLAEMPNVKKCYEHYHDQGFEVIGVSLDKDREALDTYLSENVIPWSIVHDRERRNPTADYYGIKGIPTLILVGSDGKVVSTKARGPELRKALANIFGPIKEDEPAVEETSMK